MNKELDKIEESGSITWLNPEELDITPKNAKIVSLTLFFNYKSGSDGSIEEQKSRASIRREKMRPNVHFDLRCTSTPIVDRMAAWMVISHSFERGWSLEHLDVRSEFLHEEYRYGKPVYIREMPRADGTYYLPSALCISRM